MGNERKEVRSARTLHIISMTLMCLIILTSAAALICGIIELIILAPYDSGDSLFYLSDFRIYFIMFSSVVDVGWSILTLGFIIVYLMWIFRVYKNLQAVNIQNLHHTPGWAVGWYFIPFANLVKPYTIMKETYLASMYAIGSSNWRDMKVPGTLLIWWLLYIFGNIITGQNLSADYETIHEYRYDAVISIITEPMFMISGILLIMIMHRITKVQDQELEKRQIGFEDERTEEF